MRIQLLHPVAMFTALALSPPVIAQSGTDPSQEPPSTIEVTLGGQKLQVLDGAPFSTGGCEGSVRISPVKTFQNSAVSFDYPRHFAFEYDGTTEGVRQWTLDGNSVVLIITEIDAKAALKDMEDGMIGRFGAENCTSKDTHLRLGGTNLKGRHLDVNVVGTALGLDLLEIPWKEGASAMLFIQDTKTESGGHPEEHQRCMALLEETMRYRGTYGNKQ